MPHLPARFATVVLHFAPLFCQRSWRHAEVLLPGAILAPGTCTVTRLPRITGLAQERHIVNYHRVLNRAVWNPRAGGDILLRLLLAAVVPQGPVVVGLFSLVTVLAARLSAAERRTVATSTWYRKSQPRFSDTLARVRRHLWRAQGFAMSRRGHNVAKLKPALPNAIVYALCNAA